MFRAPIRTLRVLAAAVTTVVVTVPFASSAPAVTLHGGDVVVLAREYTTTPGVLLHLTVATGVIDTIVPDPPLATPRDLVVCTNGVILVADATLGLVGIDPLSGAAGVTAGPAAFGGSGPTALARAADGDLLLAGPSGVYRVPADQVVPQSVSGPGLLSSPTGIVDDGAGGMWVTDDNSGYLGGGGIVHVSAGGAQAVMATSCASHSFPILPLQIRRGPDQFLYVVNGPYSGPTNYLNAGIFRLDPASGVATQWSTTHFIRGFAFATDGSAWVLSGRDISHDPYDGVLARQGEQVSTGARGPLALVPDHVTRVRARTWGALKSLYR